MYLCKSFYESVYVNTSAYVYIYIHINIYIYIYIYITACDNDVFHITVRTLINQLPCLVNAYRHFVHCSTISLVILYPNLSSCCCTERPVEIVRRVGNQRVTVLPGRATFVCELSKPRQLVGWTKRGKVLPPGDKYTMTAEGNVYSLVVDNIIGEEDVGEYGVEMGTLSSAAQLLIEGISWL